MIPDIIDDEGLLLVDVAAGAVDVVSASRGSQGTARPNGFGFVVIGKRYVCTVDHGSFRVLLLPFSVLLLLLLALEIEEEGLTTRLSSGIASITISGTVLELFDSESC